MAKGAHMTYLTRELLKNGMCKQAGISRAQLRLIGLDWPPKKGWMDAMVGVWVDDLDYERFCQIGRAREARINTRREATDNRRRFAREF